MPDLKISERFAFDSEVPEPARIKVVGVGGGGGNAITNMIAKGINGIDFVAINTDVQALDNNPAPVKVQIGRELTKGLGAGARPSIGAEAAEENRQEIEQALQGCDMLFITAGMGGGTGTGAAPVVAAISKKLDVLTVAIVTKPFACEGKKRQITGEEGIKLLAENVDTLIVIPNERLLGISEPGTTLIDAFKMVDEVLYNATRGISDLITVHGLINLDFADIKTTMVGGGTALMGVATATGENRAEKAAVEAISSPLLDGVSINGARNILVNITASESLGIKEATTATEIVNREAGNNAEVIFGTVIDPEMGDKLRVTVIATGFDQPAARDRHERGYGREVRMHEYKGESNLKALDTPAFIRRDKPSVAPELRTPPVAEVDAATVSEVPRPTVRKIQASELEAHKERIRKDDPDTPAFLRKMMD